MGGIPHPERERIVMIEFGEQGRGTLASRILQIVWGSKKFATATLVFSAVFSLPNIKKGPSLKARPFRRIFP
jgi:hypothetical protein